MMYKKNPKLLNQFQYCEKEEVPLIVIVGEDEKTRGGVKIREVVSRNEVMLLHRQIHHRNANFFCRRSY